MKKSESSSACMHKKIHEKGQGVPVFSHKNQYHPDQKKQISKCWKLVIDPLDSHPLSHNISPLQAERLDQAINLQLSARVMQNYNDFVSGMQMVAASVSLLVDGSMGGP